MTKFHYLENKESFIQLVIMRSFGVFFPVKRRLLNYNYSYKSLRHWKTVFLFGKQNQFSRSCK